MKTLKFSDELIERILRKEKKSTWRVNDEKNILPGDRVSLCNKKGIEFAQALVLEVRDTKFGELAEGDYENHENYNSKEQMYRMYKTYYGIDVNDETPLKIIKFELIE
jgi:hypothetical protein